MAKANFSLDNFKSTVLGAGLARTNRFEVIITPPRGFSNTYATKVSLLCEQANLPMLNISTKPHRIYGPNYQRPITSEYGGEGLPLTFHVDRNMDVKTFFDDWMQTIVNDATFNVAYQEEYISEVEIFQLDEQDNITYAVKLLEAFPRSMNLMDLNHSSTNQTHRLTVLFAYRRWIRTD